MPSWVQLYRVLCVQPGLVPRLSPCATEAEHSLVPRLHPLFCKWRKAGWGLETRLSSASVHVLWIGCLYGWRVSWDAHTRLATCTQLLKSKRIRTQNARITIWKPLPPLLEKSQTEWKYCDSSLVPLSVRRWEWHRRKAASLQLGRCWPPAQRKQKNKLKSQSRDSFSKSGRARLSKAMCNG